MDGLLVVDKPVGPTSHDVVAYVRRALRSARVGHTGTLDPAASGVLPLLVGRATRLARFLSTSDKHYEAVVRLGWSTDTGDARGTQVGEAYRGAMPHRDAIDAVLNRFRGTFLQQPPAYSAKKIDGRRSYKLARANAGTLPEPVTVTAHSIELMAVDDGLVSLSVECSAGFYVRSLAADLGAQLGTGGHLSALRRTRSGAFAIDRAVTLDALEGTAAVALVPLVDVLPEMSSVVLTPSGTKHAARGCDLGPADVVSRSPSAAGWVRLVDAAGMLVGVARVQEASGLLHPSVVLV